MIPLSLMNILKWGFHLAFLLLDIKAFASQHANVLKNQTAEEADFMKFHICKDAGEVYAASYLITKEYLFLRNTDYNLTWVNCEMASFIMMNQNWNSHGKDKPGTIIQSLDVLDFSIIHLSAFERLERRHSRLLPYQSGLKRHSSTMTVMEKLSKVLKSTYYKNQGKIKLSRKQNRTLAIMPFVGSAMGAGHSVLSNRYEYLKACVWSIYAHFQHIIVVVSSETDYDYARNSSGLPLMDVILLPSLPKTASLPVGTVLAIKERLQNGTYDFDFVYYTESDQVLLLRSADSLYDLLDIHPHYFISPHRLMPYPDFIVSKFIQRPVVHTQDKISSWANMSCCMPRQNCMTRADWGSIKSHHAPIMSIYDLAVPLGNCNFLQELYHGCTLYSTVQDVCP